MRSTLVRRHLFNPTLALVPTLAFVCACAGYEVVDYPSALDEPPSALWVNWDYAELRIGKKSEAEWLASRRLEAVRERHGELKQELAIGYAIELGGQLGGWVDVYEGIAPNEGLQLEVRVQDWLEGVYVAGVEPVQAVSVPTVVEVHVDFIDGGQLMESLAVDCVVDARLWSIYAQDRFGLCGEQLGKATAKYILDRVAAD